jgi:2-oxoglutarate ferredoxin oxidoreductase subunit gamma
LKQILIAGFGGQGILFAGKFLAYAGMAAGLNVSWLPSYGPETRGGTSNCSVILSETQIGSPVVLNPDLLICMNLPSLNKFEDTLASGGLLFIDSTLVERRAKPGVNAFYIPATGIADEHGMMGLANMIIIGKVIKETGIVSRDAVTDAMKKVISERRKDMFELNINAVKLGFDA